MKKRYLYLVTLGLFVVAAGIIVLKYKNGGKGRTGAFYPLLERKNSSLNAQEWKNVQKRFDDAIKMARTDPADVKSRIELASLYIHEARVTGNYMYYDRAALGYVNEILDNDPQNFEALTFKALLFLSQHHFADGLALAEKAKEINPYNALVYGILVDGNVEMGNYEQAIKDADKMVSIRPDMRSYSRVSYLREIHGDYPGAIEAMKMAVEAGPPGDEATEWTRAQLGHLYEQTGDLKSAEMHYLISLQYRPGYAYAIAGLARIASSQKDYQKAIGYYLQADSLVNDYSFKEQLAEIYELTGDKAKATELNNWLIEAMTRDAESGNDNESIGHYADRELAHAFLRVGKYDKALEHAIAEYNRRPGNIDAGETVAWIYYAKGDVEKATRYIETALKTGSNNPALLAHAGLIYAKLNDKSKARMLLDKIDIAHVAIHPSLKSQVSETIKAL